MVWGQMMLIISVPIEDKDFSVSYQMVGMMIDTSSNGAGCICNAAGLEHLM